MEDLCNLTIEELRNDGIKGLFDFCPVCKVPVAYHSRQAATISNNTINLDSTHFLSLQPQPGWNFLVKDLIHLICHKLDIFSILTK